MEFWLANLRLPSSQWNLARSKRRYSIHGAADIRSPNGSGNNVNASQVGTSTPTCNVSVVPNSGSWSLLQLKFHPGILSWPPCSCSHIPVDNHHEAWVKLTLVRLFLQTQASFLTWSTRRKEIWRIFQRGNKITLTSSSPDEKNTFSFR